MHQDQFASLEVRGLTKRYNASLALDQVDVTLRAGEIHALLGENGAGKSTLIKAVTGAVQRDGGTVRMNGVPIAPANPREAVELGLATVYQEVNLLPNLSVAANIFLGREPTRFGLVRNGEMRRRAAEILHGFGLEIDVAAPLGDFSVAVQHITAIARAVDLSARVLILDEPTASLDAQEVDILFGVLRDLKRRDVAILMVSHFLDQVYAVCDRITVLRNGRLVGERRTSDLSKLELVHMMLGREQALGGDHVRRSEALATAPALASFTNYGKTGSVAPFDLSIGEREVLGLVGLLGSGRTETVRLIFGADRADTGQATVEGKSVRITCPRDAIRLRFAYSPEERKTEGVLAELTVRENITLAVQARRGALNPLSRRDQVAIAARYIDMLDIRPRDPEQPIGLLSGGNQQKVLLARWLATDPRLLILDEPTRGIDVGAHAEIIRLVRKLCNEGVAMLIVSSELEEIVTYSDRVVVLRDRAHVAELRGDAISVPTIMAAIASDGARAP